MKGNKIEKKPLAFILYQGLCATYYKQTLNNVSRDVSPKK